MAVSKMSWEKFFRKSRNAYEGYTSSYTKMDQLLKEYFAATGTKFVQLSSSRKFTNEIETETQLIIKSKALIWRWQELRAKPQIPFEGIPHIPVGKRCMECHHGHDWQKEAKEKRMEARHSGLQGVNKKKRTRYTKKFDCRARIYIRHVIMFPEYQVASSKKKFSIANYFNLDSVIRRNIVKKEHRFYISLPDLSCHSDHEISNVFLNLDQVALDNTDDVAEEFQANSFEEDAEMKSTVTIILDGTSVGLIPVELPVSSEVSLQANRAKLSSDIEVIRDLSHKCSDAATLQRVNDEISLTMKWFRRELKCDQQSSVIFDDEKRIDISEVSLNHSSKILKPSKKKTRLKDVRKLVATVEKTSTDFQYLASWDEILSTESIETSKPLQIDVLNQKGKPEHFKKLSRLSLNKIRNKMFSNTHILN